MWRKNKTQVYTLTEEEEAYYAELAERWENNREDFIVYETTYSTPEESLKRTLEEHGCKSYRELKKMALRGRPPKSQRNHQPIISPTVRSRVSQDLKNALEAVSKKTGRTESDIVREAVARYVHELSIETLI